MTKAPYSQHPAHTWARRGDASAEARLGRASSAIPIVKIEEETWSGDHLSFG